MRYTVSKPDFTLLDESEEMVGKAATGAMRAVTDGLKGDLREQVIAAGLGPRLANTWRGRTYPQSQSSLEPSGYVWSKAPKLIDAYDRGAVIRPHDGKRWLWIPTKSVPKSGRQRMTPEQVAAAFRVKQLIVRPGRDGHKLAFVNAVAGRSTRRPSYRGPTPRRLAQGRAAKLVLMFTLVPLVQVRRRLGIETAADRWAGRFEPLFHAGLK